MSKKIVVAGSINLDMVARVPRNPAVGETITGTDFQRFIGGKGANQAVAASLSGGDVQMIARHGTDGFETELLATLHAKGVNLERVTPADGPSGIAVILVTDDGHNSIVVIPGANGLLRAADIQAQRISIEQAGMVLTQLETPLDALLALAEITHAANIPLMLDPAPAQTLPAELMHRVDWFTPNETEAAFYLGQPVPLDGTTHGKTNGATEGSIRDFAERLMALGPKNILLKLGARGAYLATAEGLREFVAAKPVQAVDSTAAGDALNGAFAASLMIGADPVEALRFGVAAASLSVTRGGAIPSLPTLDETNFFRRQP